MQGLQLPLISGLILHPYLMESDRVVEFLQQGDEAENVEGVGWKVSLFADGRELWRLAQVQRQRHVLCHFVGGIGLLLVFVEATNLVARCGGVGRIGDGLGHIIAHLAAHRV